MRQALCLILSFSFYFSSLLISGCSGREANPVATYMSGDDKRSCEALKTEYSDSETQIKKLQSEKSTYDRVII